MNKRSRTFRIGQNIFIVAVLQRNCSNVRLELKKEEKTKTKKTRKHTPKNTNVFKLHVKRVKNKQKQKRKRKLSQNIIPNALSSIVLVLYLSTTTALNEIEKRKTTFDICLKNST